MKNFWTTFFSIEHLLPTILIIAILIYFLLLGIGLIIGKVRFEDGDIVPVRKEKHKYYTRSISQRIFDICFGIFCIFFVALVIFYVFSFLN